MVRKRSFRKFYHRLKVLSCVLFFAAAICFCLALIKNDYRIVGYTSDYVSWFRTNRNISSFLRLNERTHLVVPNAPPEWSTFSDKVQVVYFVTSSPSNRIARNVVRSTWGKTVRPSPIFLTGFVEDQTEMDFLYNEAKLHNDLIIENFLDTYTNLTLKTGFIFKHFLRMYPNSSYLMKTDDDVLVNTGNIANIVKESVENRRNGQLPIIGRLYEPYRAHRDPESKWYIPHWMYGKDYLPAYVSGTGYLVPGDSIEKILKSAADIPMLPLEDVYFLGLVANGFCKIPLEHNRQFVDVRPIFTHYCSYKKLATLHHLDSSELFNIWLNLHSESDRCSGYLYKIYDLIFG